MVDDLAPGARRLVGDMGHDADRIRQDLPLRDSAREEPLPLDRDVHRRRNRVERLCNRLEQFRAVATRDDKAAASCLALVRLAAASRLWLRLVHTA